MTTYSTQFLGKIVTVIVDRALGSLHPRDATKIVEQNYGYIPDVPAPDGDDLDAYILGINEPIESFTGRCIAVIHRTNDEDDKLVVVPDGVDYSDNEIRKLTDFAEKYFESVIVR